MLVSMVVHFFYTPFLLKKVGDDQYGLYNFATSALSWLSVAVNAILSAYNKVVAEEIVKDEENGERKINSVYSFIVICWASLISVVASVLLIFMSTGIINLDVYSSEDQKTILILFGIVSIQMIITVATKVANLNITYNNHHIWVKMSTLMITGLTPLVTLPFIINGKGIITVVIIQVILNSISHIADILYDRFFLKKRYSIIPKKEDFKIIKPIFTFCSIILINEIAFQLDNSIDNIALGMKGYSEEITLYSLALSIVTIASTCSSMIYIPLIPTVFSNEASGKREENLKLYDLVTFAQTSLWLFITGAFISCGKEFVFIWIGKDREIVYYICSALFLIRSVNNCAGPSKDMMRASNKHLQTAVLAVGITCVNTILTVLFVNVLPRENAIWGCVIGTGVASIAGWWIAANIMNYVFLKTNTKKFLLNFIFIFILMTTSCAISILLNKFYLEKALSNNWIKFIVLCLSFIITFTIFMAFFYKAKLKEICLLLKKK